MEDDKLAIDESRRAQQHGAVKREIEGGVGSEIRARARVQDADPHEAQMIDAAASHMRNKAIHNVVSTEAEIEHQRRVARIGQYIDYAFYLIYGLLSLRFFLGLIGARQSAGLVQFINTITSPLYLPFKGIVPSPSADAGYTFSAPILVALVVYVLLHAAVKGFLRVSGRRKTDI